MHDHLVPDSQSLGQCGGESEAYGSDIGAGDDKDEHAYVERRKAVMENLWELIHLVEGHNMEDGGDKHVVCCCPKVKCGCNGSDGWQPSSVLLEWISNLS